MTFSNSSLSNGSMIIGTKATVSPVHRAYSHQRLDASYTTAIVLVSSQLFSPPRQRQQSNWGTEPFKQRKVLQMDVTYCELRARACRSSMASLKPLSSSIEGSLTGFGQRTNSLLMLNLHVFVQGRKQRSRNSLPAKPLVGTARRIALAGRLLNRGVSTRVNCL
jgi:hypothetical protein